MRTPKPTTPDTEAKKIYNIKPPNAKQSIGNAFAKPFNASSIGFKIRVCASAYPQLGPHSECINLSTTVIVKEMMRSNDNKISGIAIAIRKGAKIFQHLSQQVSS